MSTKKVAPKPIEEPKVGGYQPVWRVGYGSRTLMLAADTAEEAIREACERDYVLAALPLVAEPVITADGFHVVALPKGVTLADAPAADDQTDIL